MTHKDGDLEPGRGFYEMAKSLGIDVGVPFEYWSIETQKVFTMHGDDRRGRPSKV